MSQAVHTPVRRVAVVGAGTIGASWAAHFLAHGLDVVVSDPAPGAEGHTQHLIDGAWPVLQALGTAQGDPRGWRFEPDPVKAVEGVDFVQENAPERYEVKRKLLPLIDAVLPREVVIASSSSGLLVSRFSDGCRFPDRCVIGHPFNPPHLIPLVEVVGGKTASRAAIDAAMAFYKAIGKRPIEIRKEVTGHVANRLQAALWREAIYLVQEGVASVADIDAAVTEGPGLRWALMGPHMTFNLGGGQGGLAHFMDHLLPAVESWWADLGTPNMTPELQRTLVEGVKAEAEGRSMTELAQWRDKLLTQIITLRAASAAAADLAAVEARLDEALEETFPGSDPVSVTRQTPAEDIEGDPSAER
ncbi:3-hydroxyacyl-CoA dehydrogenase NAD-binding domain-containing protein [Xanthobacter agilis]|uniref:3-hydroxyacyl-CoA dehydrogenase n=1 Tax=Xanthobacter agilis TaxID=47492 RepID=A0ABU0L889_XANAG|nr:3-hydroxyacyl-CoA dehydrogenase NAD-binding domain-containing protein [Xanthobacter agilis]MDQ0503341.1 3-hydroxyacyl-CoA dehydrogenase [Xanthobacter agilis]